MNSNITEFKEWKAHWLDLANKLPGIKIEGTNAIQDFIGVEILSPFITGFMTSPAAIYNDKPFEILVRQIENFQEFKGHIKSSGKLTFLYQLLWLPSMPIYYEFDNNLGMSVIIVGGPKIKFGYWLAKYAEIEKT